MGINLSSLPFSLSGRYAVIVAHPDDEVLWFSSVLANAAKIIICYGDYAGDSSRGANRRRAIAQLPLQTVEFLDLPEGGFHMTADWNRPAVCDHGLVLKSASDRSRYAENFNKLLGKLTPLLSDVDLVFTHNPWGEYGHEDHVQLFHAVNLILRRRPDSKLAVPGYSSPKSALLKSRYVRGVGRGRMQMPTNAGLAHSVMQIYKANQCWTWTPDWKVPEFDTFLMTTPATSDFSYCPPAAADLPVVGGMATIPSRKADLPRILRSILPFLDHLYLWFDHYDEVPEAFRSHGKITPLLGKKIDEGLGCSGKFYGLRLLSERCLYVCFDDDIIYPPDYLYTLASAVRRYSGRMLVGVHAKIYSMFPQSYARDRTCLHFENGAALDCLVDELGTGTIAFQSDFMPVQFDKWSRRNMSDVNLMVDCVRHGVARVSIRRPKGWLRPVQKTQPDSIWKATLHDDEFQTRLINEAMQQFPDRWTLSAAAGQH